MDKSISTEFDGAPKEETTTPPPPLSYDSSSSEDEEDPEDVRDEAELHAAHAMFLFIHVMTELPADYVPELTHLPDLDREREISAHFNDAAWWEVTNPDMLPPLPKRSRNIMNHK